MKNIHTDTKVKITAKEQTFNNSTLRMLSQFERVQIETTMKNKIIDSETALAIHRVDSASDRKRGREREREKSRGRERRDRGRGQAAMSKEA